MKHLYTFLISCLFVCVSVVSAFSQATTYNPSLFIQTDINVGDPAFPFPQFLEYKGGGKSLAKYNAEGVTHADMEKSMREAYEIMMHRCRYMGGTHCGVPYITFNHESVPENYGTFVSEGDGYALLAAAIFADQKTFNGLYMWVHDHRMSGVTRFQDGRVLRADLPDFAGPYLAGWKNDETTTSMSPSHSATDGDVDIAMAMLIAYKQWGEWMIHDGNVVRDYAGNPISLKEEAFRVISALVDTLPQWDKGSGQISGYLSGDIGIDGYCKKGNSWGELTRWRFSADGNARYPGMNGPWGGGPNLYSQYGTLWIDYDAPSYFDEFYRWFKDGDGGEGKPSVDWQIHQFQRAAASGNYLNREAYKQGYIASIGNVTIGDTGENPQFNIYVDGEDFRYAWRHLVDYLWHGEQQYDWDPVTHQVIEGTNNSEYDMGMRHAQILKNPTRSGVQICEKMGASPDPGQPSWFGVAQIPQQWTFNGGITSPYHTNYSVGAGSPAAVISEDMELLADIYRQCEIAWDGNNTASKLDPEERYIGSTPKYFHGWFRTLGMLVCSGNLHAPEDMLPSANMKVYMSVDKTYAYEGDNVSYYVQYRNYGSADATDVKIQTPLDEDYTFVSASDGGTYDEATHTITWNLGTVKGFKSGRLNATQDSVKFTVKITSLKNARVCETSTITASNCDPWISNEYPNHATYTMERNCVDVLANRSLVVNKTANRFKFNPNDAVTFTVDFENVSSDDAWMNGGRDHVRISYGNYYMNGNAYQFYHLYRFWNDSYEAYINMNNYRLSYFMYDAAAIGLYDAATNNTGWTFVVDNQNDLDKYGYNPESGPITFAYQKIPQGQDANGKWNQRLMIRFADVLMAPTTHVYDKLDSDYLLHKGVRGPGFIRARLASNPNADLTTRIKDDWSFSSAVTENTLDGQGTTFTLVSPCWANYDNLGYEIDNYSRHVCNPASVSNYERVLVEEFDGYTWRRIQGTGPLPGKEAYNVTIVDTIPLELQWKEFIDNKGLGVQATYTPAPAGAKYTGIVKWTVPEMLVGEKDQLKYVCVAKDMGCPNVDDIEYVNAAWIYSDTDSPDSSSVTLMTTCAELPPFVEPQNSLFKTASTEIANVGDVISYELKYVNTTGTRVDEDCNSTTNWQAFSGGSLPAIASGGGLKLNTNGSGAYFFGPNYSYGMDGAVYATFGGSPSSTQELYIVFRHKSGTPGNSNHRGICMKMFINKDGKNNYGYELYSNGTLIQKEGSSWQDVLQFPGSSDSPMFKFVLQGDHLYMYINDQANDWQTVVKDWGGLTTAPGNFGMYVNSNGNSNTKLTHFTTELDYAFDIQMSDLVPPELAMITNISGGGTFNASTNKITWATVGGPLAPNEEISYTFDATVNTCNKYINNTGFAKSYGQDEIKVVNTITCGATACPEPPEVEPITYCKGDIPQNLTAVGTKLLWYTETSAVGASSLKPATDVAGTTSYFVTQTVGGCESDRAELVVTVNETALPTVDSPQAFCSNATLEPLSAVGKNLTWYSEAKLPLTEAPTPDVSVAKSTYYVTQTIDGCESDFAEIEVNINTPAKPLVSTPILYCQGDSPQPLSATATGDLFWYNSEMNDFAFAPTPQTSKVKTTSYFVKQVVDGCESELAEIQVVVKPTPEATIVASADAFCSGAASVDLSLDSEVDLTGATYVWTNSAVAATLATTSTAIATTKGDYVCKITLDGCEFTTSTKTITESENPTYSIIGEGSYCPDATNKKPVAITFLTGVPPFTFTENIVGERTATAKALVIDNPVGGIYQITELTDGNGCKMVGKGPSVEVVDLEVPDLVIATPKSVCVGIPSVDITQYITFGNGVFTFSTDKGDISSDGELTNISTAGDYTIQVTLQPDVEEGTAYCTNTKSVVLTVFDLPEVSLENSYSVCSQTELTLEPIVNETASNSYLWSGAAAAKFNGTSLKTPVFVATETTQQSYDVTLKVTDKNTTCVNEVSSEIVVNPRVEVELNTDKDLYCLGENFEITASLSNETIAGTHTWSSDLGELATWSSGNTKTSVNVKGSALSAGDFTVNYQFVDENSCESNKAIKTITIAPLPKITLSASKTDVCVSGSNSDNVMVKPSLTAGTLNFSVDKGASISNSGELTVAGLAAGVYTVSLDYADENGCEDNSATTQITVHDLPAVSFLNTNPTELCYNSSEITLAVSPASATATKFSFVGTSGEALETFNPSTSAVGDNEITYNFTDEFGCSATAQTTINVVKVLPPTIDEPNPRTVTIDEFNNLLDVTTMIATPNVATDNVVWQTIDGTKLVDGNSYTSPETTENEYTYFAKEYRTVNGGACYSDSTKATLVLSSCTAKSPLSANQILCVGSNGNITLQATQVEAVATRSISWFSDKGLTAELSSTDSYNTTVETSAEQDFKYYAAEYDQIKDCWSVPTEVTVSVKPLPEVSFTVPSESLCYYNQTYLPSGIVNGVASNLGTWSIENNELDINSTTGVIDLTSAGKIDGTYNLSYTYQDENQCVGTFQESIKVEFPEKPSSQGYTGIMSNPDEVEISVDATSLEIGSQVEVHWYTSATETTAAFTGNSWKTGDDPATEHVSTYYLTQQVNGCESEKAEAIVEIISCPAPRPNVIQPEPICLGQTIDGSTVVASLGEWASRPTASAGNEEQFRFYKTETGGTPETENIQGTFAPLQSLQATAGTLTYWVAEYNHTFACEGKRAKVSFVINELPEVEIENPDRILCYDEGEVQISAKVNNAKNNLGTWAVTGNASCISAMGVFNTQCGGTTDKEYEITYSYTNEFGCSNNASLLVSVEYPDVPTAENHSSLTINPDPVILTAENIEPSAMVNWYSANVVTTHANPWTTADNPAIAHTAVYSVSQTVHGCESQKAEVTVLIENCPVPKPVIAQPESICNYEDLPEITASLGDWAGRPVVEGAAELFKLYDAEDSDVAVAQNSEGKFEPTGVDLSKSGTYNYWISEYNSVVGCEGKRSKVSFSVSKTPEPIIVNLQNEVCFGSENPLFSAQAAGTPNWYESEPTIPSTSVEHSTAFVPMVTAVGTHSVWLTQTIDGCESQPVSAQFTIHAVPNAPEVENVAVCEGSPSQELCATADENASISWYANAGKSGSLAKTECYKPMVNSQGEYSFYVTQTVDGCESLETEVVYTVLTLPQMPRIETEIFDCEYNTEHSLLAIPQYGAKVIWYRSSQLDTKVGEGETFVHQIESSGSQSYFARQELDGCLSQPSQATFTIHTRPPMPKVTNVEVCSGASATLTTDYSKDLWYADQELTQIEGQGYELNLNEVTQNQTFYVVRELNNCQSIPAEATVSVIAPPTIQFVIDEDFDSETTLGTKIVSRCEYEAEQPLAVELSPASSPESYVEWRIFPSNKVVKAGESIMLSDYVQTTPDKVSSTNYMVRAQYFVKNQTTGDFCASAVDTIRAVTNAKARRPIVFNTVICQGEEIEPIRALGSKNIVWSSIDGILPVTCTGQKYIFAKQNEIPVGQYRFYVIDYNEQTGCSSDTVIAELAVAPAAETKIFGADSVCLGETENYYTQYTKDSYYHWSVTGDNLNYSKDATSSSVRYVDWINAGIDTIAVFEQTWAGCVGYDTLVVKIAENPKAMFSYSLPGSLNIIELVDSTQQAPLREKQADSTWYEEEVSYKMLWNFGHVGEDNSTIDLEVPYEKRNFPIVEGEYVYGFNCPILTVVNSYGCSDTYTDCIFVNITSGLYVPNAFAPMNPAHGVRKFTIKGYNIKECNVSVYDKWGNLVWYSNEVENGEFKGEWDGCNGGKPLPADVYIWKMDATFLDGQEWEGFESSSGKRVKFGNVVLIR